ncbi:hypothetical protein B0H39_004132 [Clostridium beijerinckii]|nr:hypothetical protein [Clostridium beijerinckii]NOV69910.1 hypothetical protein [Clostridium beijerinckii]NOW31182.1 hypothetical protein [Clostridium beijerinckii]NOW86251.1 hypothetical protein [Clostridium beijerinckii]
MKNARNQKKVLTLILDDDKLNELFEGNKIFEN